ncbi:MAG: ABC transporter ATP-binding protein [Candidatus Thorarchaeota archaeon]|nr:ABC transporter ATP-binding protein [Candidatus Thorarchaeota archaeon]
MYAVELENISKTFPGGVQANKNITLRVKKGEVHGLLGENGAGKSTLMNVLYGLLQSDEGRIIVNGSEVRFNSPNDAIAQGVGMVHQHFKLIPTLTVAENIVLGMEPKSSKPTRSGISISVLLSAFAIILMGLFLPIELALLGTFILLLSVVILYFVFRIANLSERLGLSRLGKLGLVLEQIGGVIATLSQNLMPIGYGDAVEKIKQISKENGLDIDPTARIEDVSVGLQQRVEIIKTLYREADILVLDEPTSVLTPQEVDDLFVTLERFRKAGKTIILITHKLREPMALCDRISVLRDGELVGTVEKAETSPEELAQMMVGRPVVFRVEKTPAAPSDVVLDVKNLEVLDSRNLLAVKGISIQVRSGEILGIAGVQGNGQTELVEAIVGLRKPRSGSVLIGGNDTTGANPRKVRASGVSHIPEDRQKRGLVLDFTVEENLALGQQYLAPYATGPLTLFLDLESMENISREVIDAHSIKVQSSKSLANTLSGGNQQKVIVARELGTKPRLVVAAQPTRGLDVGATEFIHNKLISMRDAGVAILLVSAELDEIRTLSDRIAVIFDGKIMAIRDPAETTTKELGLLMAGHENRVEGVSA